MHIAVIGAGTMGAGIAQSFALASFDVYLHDVSEQARQRGLKAIESSLERLVAKARVSKDARDEALSRLTLVGDYASVHDAGAVIEAVYEDIAVKREVWQALGGVVSQDALLATNTSSLSVTEIASFVPRPERFCGLHFFNPVPLMPLVEVVRALQTSDDTLVRARELAEKIGKSPIVCEDKPGFIVNRLLIPYLNDAIHALSEGVASAEEIDKAMKLGANMPQGPLALADLVGLDVTLAAAESLYREFGDSKFRVPPLLRQMVRAGKLGRKSGEGFYRY
jgi:3-hydroxybutyryl-CoA dehydrogenase